MDRRIITMLALACLFSVAWAGNVYQGTMTSSTGAPVNYTATDANGDGLPESISINGGAATPLAPGQQIDIAVAGGGSVRVVVGTTGNDSGANRIDEANSPFPLLAFGGNGDDEIRGTNVWPDHLWGGAGDDDMNGRGGDDTLNGEAGDDELGSECPGFTDDPGNDRMNGGNDNDEIGGGGGNDILNGDSGNDKVNGGDGNDACNGGEGNDTLHGNDGNDNLTDTATGPGGGADTDKAYGDAGDDTINTADGDGNDTANGGTGTDAGTVDTGDSASSIENLVRV